MKRICLFMAVLGVTIAAATQVYGAAWEVKLDDYMGGVVYKEDGRLANTEIRSKATAFYSKTTLSFCNYDNEGLEGELFYSMFLTGQAEEAWDVDTIRYQTNDLSFWGLETGWHLGWAIPVDINKDFDVTITPLAGYRWKFMRFTRQNFNILNTITIAETVDEDYEVHSIDVGGKITVGLTEDLEIFVKPILGIVTYNSATNSVLGTIKGDGGLFFDGSLGLDYAITEDIVVGLMFRTELQQLRGNEKNGVLWPDNTLNIYGGSINIKYKF
ncbi:MAG: hypothetical protein ABH869_03290 [Candidatus Omnitrophota bacterium]